MKLNLEWISNKIGNEYKQWQKGDVVCIKAQTGTGKTYFIKNKLINDMFDNEKMLILVNRTKLREQVDKDLEKLHGNKNNIKIMSYQELENINIRENVDLNKYDYIVCDEIHYVYSDSSFNNKTKEIFDLLFNDKHDKSVKIFMSATIRNAYKMIKNNNKYNRLWKYGAKNNYSYVNVKYFKELDDIIQLIKNDNTDEKWLIFVTRKADIDYIKLLLKEDSKYRKYKISYATSNKSSKDLQNIVDKSMFESKVFITTKVLDNGININDDKLTNIVIMTYDEETFIQELGRKRIDIEDAQQVNLYIRTCKYKTFRDLYLQVSKQQEIISELLAGEEDFFKKYNRDLQTLCKKTNNAIYFDEDRRMYINEVAIVKRMNDKNFYGEMKTKIYSDKFAFIKEQLKWMGLENTFSEDNIINAIDKKEIEQLKLFLDENLDIKLVGDKKSELFSLILNSKTLYKDKDYRTNFEIKTKKLNEIIQQNCRLEYTVLDKQSSRMVDGKKKNYRYLKISKK